MKRTTARQHAYHRVKTSLLISLLPLAGIASGWANPVVVQDFEKEMTLPKPWVMNMPDENVSVKFFADHPHDGKQSLQWHYKFTSGNEFHYLGVPLELNFETPSSKLRYWVYGDKSLCSVGVQINDASGKTYQFKLGVIDFTGGKEIVIDLDASHETWGGDKSAQIDFPIKSMNLTLNQPTDGGLRRAAESDLFFDSIRAGTTGGIARQSFTSFVAARSTARKSSRR